MVDKKMREALEDAFAEIKYCINSVQGALRHRKQPQDYHFHAALKACCDGRVALSTKQEPPSLTLEDMTDAATGAQLAIAWRKKAEGSRTKYAKDEVAKYERLIAKLRVIIDGS